MEKRLKAKAKSLEGEIFAFLSALGVTGYFLINRYVYTYYKPASIDYTSTFIAIAGAIGLFSYIARKLLSKKAEKAQDVSQMVLVGLVAGAAIGLTVIGQKYTLATNAAIITTITVLSTAFFSYLFLKQALPRKTTPWLIMMLVGVYIAIIGFTSYHPHSGDWIIIAATILFGISNVLTHTAMKNNSPGLVRDMRFMTAGGLFALLILLHPTVSFVHGIGVYPYAAALFFWTGILFFNKAVKLIGPSHAIVINNSHIVVTMLISVPVLSEVLALHKVLGAAIVLIAIKKISSKK